MRDLLRQRLLHEVVQVESPVACSNTASARREDAGLLLEHARSDQALAQVAVLLTELGGAGPELGLDDNAWC